jgi:hypothetical protein
MEMRKTLEKKITMKNKTIKFRNKIWRKFHIWLSKFFCREILNGGAQCEFKKNENLGKKI